MNKQMTIKPTIKPAIWGWLCRAFILLFCVGSVLGRANAADDSVPRFIFMTYASGAPWHLLKLPGDDNIMVVSWDEANKNPMCLAAIGEGGTGDSCLRPYQTIKSDNARKQIAQIGQRNNKNQLIGTLTCDAANYVAAYGKVDRNDPTHWCNIVRVRLEKNGIATETSILPFIPVNGVFWHLMILKGETQQVLLAWDKANNNVMCLATVGGGNPTDLGCLRTKNTLAPEDLVKLIKLIGKRDSNNQLIGTLTCDSANYVAVYGKVDVNNKDHWCVYGKAVLGPDTPKLSAKENQIIDKRFKELEQSGQYPVLDRSSSLAGPDVNHNGVRDDIEAWINKNWTDPKENKALMQLAKTYQVGVTSDRSDVQRIRTVELKASSRAIDCLISTFPDGEGDRRGDRAFKEIRAFTLNTKERIRAYLAYDSLLSGTASPGPEPGGKSCDDQSGEVSSGSGRSRSSDDEVHAPTCRYGSSSTAFGDSICNPEQLSWFCPRMLGVQGCLDLSAFQITNRPVTAATEQMASFTVVATGNSTLSYQWQVSADSGATWTNIAGETKPTFTTGATTANTNSHPYRVVVTNGTGSVTGSTILKPVLQAPYKISAGGYHTCAIKTGGGVACWGWNGYGALGDGTRTNRLTPVAVSGLSGVTSITAGATHTCARKTDGTVACWGGNIYGALGDGANNDQDTPVVVSGLSGVTSVAAGFAHSCALKTNGAVACWGANNYGQLGDGTIVDRPTPIGVPGLSEVSSIAAGTNHSCALKTDGTVACWGSNSNGQQSDDGTIINRYRPVIVPGLSGVSSIAAGGNHTCALKTDGTVACRGYNGFGQIGDGTTTDRYTPVAVSGLSGASSIAAGKYHTCARKTDGTVACWGGNFKGQLGDGTRTNRLTPVAVSGLSGVTSITAGATHTCARKTDGTVACWGGNTYGALGDGANNDQDTPVAVSFRLQQLYRVVSNTPTAHWVLVPNPSRYVCVPNDPEGVGICPLSPSGS